MANKGQKVERAVLVYTTWPSIVEAERVGRTIVEQRLAACVNIMPGMISHYWWEGKIERAEEVVMIVKTLAAKADGVPVDTKLYLIGRSNLFPGVVEVVEAIQQQLQDVGFNVEVQMLEVAQIEQLYS